MFKQPPQLAELSKNSIDAALQFAKISMDSAERLIKLQLDAAKASIEKNAQNAKALAEAKDLQEMMSLRAALAETSVETALSYSRSVYEVASQTQSELTRLMEESMSNYNRDVVDAVEQATRSTPGSEMAMSALKSTVAATTAAVDSMTKAAKQVADVADANLKAATEAATGVAKGAASTAKKKGS